MRTYFLPLRVLSDHNTSSVSRIVAPSGRALYQVRHSPASAFSVPDALRSSIIYWCSLLVLWHLQDVHCPSRAALLPMSSFLATSPIPQRPCHRECLAKSLGSLYAAERTTRSHATTTFSASTCWPASWRNASTASSSGTAHSTSSPLWLAYTRRTPRTSDVLTTEQICAVSDAFA